jgi:hypothetical protein
MLQLLKGNDQKKKDEELDDAYNGQTQTNDNEQVPLVQPRQTVSNRGKRKATVESDGSYFALRTTSGSQPTLRSVFSSKEVV